MPSLHDDIWDRLPADFAPYEESRRRAFLLERVAPGERVLDIGCGDGRFTAALAGHGAHPVGADVSPVALARARERHSELELVPLEADGPLPFPDASFAVAWASELLGHVADTGGLLSELRRVLAPRGRLLVTTPYHGPVVPARRLDPVGPELRFYTRRSLRGLLGDFGFADVWVRAAGGVPLARRILLAEAVRPALAG